MREGYKGLAIVAACMLVVSACTGGDAPKDEKAAAHSGDAVGEEATAPAAAGGGSVVTTPSGLQYEIVTPGTGKSPKISDTVTVHYRGTLPDGKEFDSSYSRGKPATFPVGGVIKGWTEALQLMQEGAKWKLTIPSDLAYGARGAGGLIGPNQTLHFEVELIKVN